MRYRQLGSSTLRVSEIALGSWLTYSGGIEKQLAFSCVRQALDSGITLIDTANVYGRGAAETCLGGALTGVARDSYVLATKAYGSYWIPGWWRSKVFQCVMGTCTHQMVTLRLPRAPWRRKSTRKPIRRCPSSYANQLILRRLPPPRNPG